MKLKPELRAFLDTSVILYGQEIAGSNSERVMELLLEGRFTGVICQRVLDEVVAFNRRNYGREAALEARYLLLEVCEFIEWEHYAESLASLVDLINPKDREQVAACRAFDLFYLVAYDRDFEPVSEYVKPKEFVELLDEKAVETDY